VAPDAAPELTLSFDFGPFALAPSQEITADCVQGTLNNADYIDVNAVELTTATGFHHSNWFWVPETKFFGDDGVFDCTDRGFNEGVAAIYGGVLFAQSTQATHEIQSFPPGVVVRIPPHSKIIAGVHLLNASDNPLSVPLSLKITPIPDDQVTTTLAGISFENHALGLPPMANSSFTQECDIDPTYQMQVGKDPDFHIYYALGHYHTLGTGLTLEAVRPDGTSTLVYTTAGRTGDTLGGPVTPIFPVAGFTKLRYTCSYYNPRDVTVGWGVGDQEMCVFLAFSDAPINIGGGQPADGVSPGTPTVVDGVMTYTQPCTVFGIPLNQ
jgi:hypothetical protein